MGSQLNSQGIPMITIIIIDDHTRIITDAMGQMHVTRPSITGRVCSHTIRSEVYDMFDLGRWLAKRIYDRPNCPYVQVAFPLMNAEDREFLMTGIAPKEWMNMFCGNGEEDSDTRESGV